MLISNTFKYSRRLLLAFVAAMAGTALVGCSDADEEILAPSDSEVESTDSLMTVTFRAGVPVDSDAVFTRSATDGKYADVLYYVLYNEDGTKVIDTNIGGTPIAMHTGATVSVDLRVNPGKTYRVAFWAQSSEVTAYTLDAENQTMTIADYSTIPVNDAHYDAFFYTGEFTPHRGTPIETIYLKRPFQFLRSAIKTSYITAGTHKEPYYGTIRHAAFSTLNLFDGRASGYSEEVEFKYNYVANDYYSTVPTSTTYPGDYTFVAFAYVLADTEQIASCEADFLYYDSSFSTLFRAGASKAVDYVASILKRNAAVTIRYH